MTVDEYRKSISDINNSISDLKDSISDLKDKKKSIIKEFIDSNKTVNIGDYVSVSFIFLKPFIGTVVGFELGFNFEIKVKVRKSSKYGQKTNVGRIYTVNINSIIKV